MTPSEIYPSLAPAIASSLKYESSLKPWPTKQQLLASMPTHLSEKDVGKAWMSLAFSLGTSLAAYTVGCYIPVHWNFAAAWIAYAVVAGTLATGCWVLAHECGHNAFHPNRAVEICVGFLLHSLLLVPYFSWQRSHAIHHANCNHLESGETHVPSLQSSPWALFSIKLKKLLGARVYAVASIIVHLVVGWPLYLLLGVTGGPNQGFPTSHFIDIPPFNSGVQQLFPGKWKSLVRISNIGIIVVIFFLLIWMLNTSVAKVLCVYGLPYLIVNCWLVCYTWLQHTDREIPHFSFPDWDWAKGALQTVDRPYGPILNFLHHGIGSTHVVHHINPCIPHYNAWKASKLIRADFPEYIRYDSTPIHVALWRVALHCSYVVKNNQDGAYYYN